MASVHSRSAQSDAIVLPNKNRQQMRTCRQRSQNCNWMSPAGGIDMGPNLRIGLMAGGFIALAAAAVTGWVRKPDVPVPSYAYNSVAGSPAAPAVAPTTVTYDQYGQPV